MDQPFALAGVGRGGLPGKGDRDFFTFGSSAPNGEFDVALQDRTRREERVWNDVRVKRLQRHTARKQPGQWDGEAAHGGADGSVGRKHGR